MGWGDPIKWPFWSRYAPDQPSELSKNVNGSSNTPDSRYQVSAVVVCWKPPAGKEMTWQDGHVPVEVRCLKNGSWDAAVGKDFRLTEAMRRKVCSMSEQAPDDIKRRWGFTQMACWVRS
jgi:hypothetical protein